MDIKTEFSLPKIKEELDVNVKHDYAAAPKKLNLLRYAVMTWVVKQGQFGLLSMRIISILKTTLMLSIPVKDEK